MLRRVICMLLVLFPGCASEIYAPVRMGRLSSCDFIPVNGLSCMWRSPENWEAMDWVDVYYLERELDWAENGGLANHRTQL